MLKRDRFLMKLVEASGGWENFLYETLKEFYEKINNSSDFQISINDDGLMLEVQEILAAYREQQLTPSSRYFPKYGNAETRVAVPNIKAAPIKIKDNPVLDQSPAPIAIPPKVTQPRKISGRVGVDKDAGASQGVLPVPEGFRIVNKGRLTVTTSSGIELGRGNNDGQVRGSEVSGHIGNDGKYRLVFKEVSLGVGLVNFEVMPIPPAPVEIRPPALVQQVQVTPAMVAAKEAVAKEAAKVEPVKAVPIDPPRNADGSNVKQTG